jgi:hypothetical protein
MYDIVSSYYGRLVVEKSTEALNREIREAKSFDDFKRQNKNEMIDNELSLYLYELMEKYNTNPTKLSNEITVSRAYIYACLNGSKVPGRDTVIKIAFGLKADMAELNKLLKIAGHKELYSKNTRDACIIFGIEKNMNVYEIDDLIKSQGFEKGIMDE